MLRIQRGPSGSADARAQHPFHLATSRTPVEARRLPGIVLELRAGTAVGSMPRYPLEPLADLREKKAEEATRRLAEAVRKREAAARTLRAAEARREAHGAGRLARFARPSSRPSRGASSRAQDLARADAWAIRVAAERASLGDAVDASEGRRGEGARRRAGGARVAWRPGAPSARGRRRTAAAGTTHGAAGSKQGKRRRRPRRCARSDDGLEAESDRVGARGLPRVDVRERVSRRQRAGSAPAAEPASLQMAKPSADAGDASAVAVADGMPRLSVVLDDPRLALARERTLAKDDSGAAREVDRVRVHRRRSTRVLRASGATWRGACTSRRARASEAAAAFERAAAPGDGGAPCALAPYARLRDAEALVRAGRYEDAVASAQRVGDDLAARDGDEADARGRALVKGDRAGAVAVWRAFLTANPRGLRWVDVSMQLATALLDGVDGPSGGRRAGGPRADDPRRRRGAAHRRKARRGDPPAARGEGRQDPPEALHPRGARASGPGLAGGLPAEARAPRPPTRPSRPSRKAKVPIGPPAARRPSYGRRPSPHGKSERPGRRRGASPSRAARATTRW